MALTEAIRRAVLALLLIVAAAPAWAEWVRLGDYKGAIHYIDPATIHTASAIRRVWMMQDRNKGYSDGTMSARALMEYDCADERSRLLSMSAYAEPMAGGRILFTDTDPSNWGRISPNSVDATVFAVACASR